MLCCAVKRPLTMRIRLGILVNGIRSYDEKRLDDETTVDDKKRFHDKERLPNEKSNLEPAANSRKSTTQGEVIPIRAHHDSHPGLSTPTST